MKMKRFLGSMVAILAVSVSTVMATPISAAAEWCYEGQHLNIKSTCGSSMYRDLDYWTCSGSHQTYTEYYTTNRNCTVCKQSLSNSMHSHQNCQTSVCYKSGCKL